jgi:exocyst complex component 3
LGPNDSLLQIHYDLFKLERFRDESLFRAKSQGATVYSVVSKHFQKLDLLSDQFDDYVSKLSSKILPLISENHGSVVVKLLKIIEVEEKIDEEQNSYESSKPTLPDSDLSPSSFLLQRKSKNMRSKLLNTLHDVISENFSKRISPYENLLEECLNQVKFIYDDLTLVYDEVNPRFPPKYKIFFFYVIQYHKHLYFLITKLSSKNMETRDILLLTAWIREYYTIMNDRFGVSEDLLEPRLLDDNEGKLTDEYVRLIEKKLQEWVDRLLQTEYEDFISREKSPEIDTDSIYITSAPVILFQMINQQVDIAMDNSNGSKLLLDVVLECLKIMKYFQNKQISQLDGEHTKYTQAHGVKEFTPGFPEYVMAWSNNHLRCSEFVDVLQKRLEEKMEPELMPECTAHLTLAVESFMKVTKRSFNILVDIVFLDITPTWTSIYSSWNENGDQSSKMTLILNTIDDYFEDFKLRLIDYIFQKLTTELLDRFLIFFIETLHSKTTAKYKLPESISRVKSDLQMATDFWAKHKNSKRVNLAFDIVHKIVTLMESSEQMIYLSWYSIWKAYNDVPLSLIEDILAKRDDLNKNAVKEAMTNIRNKSKEGNCPGAMASIFSPKLNK